MDELKYYEKDGFLYFVNSEGKTVGFIKKYTDEERKVLQELDMKKWYDFDGVYTIKQLPLGIRDPKDCALLKPNMLKDG